MPRSQPFRAVALLILPLTACSVLTPSPGSPGTVTTRPTANVSSEPASAPESAPRDADLDDGHVMAIMVATNDAQVQYAEIALAKSKDGDIRKFALMTKFDHESVTGAVRSLAAQLDFESEDSNLATNQREAAATIRLSFRDLEGFSFDSAYIANQVEFHRSLLRTIDNVLLPAVDADEFKTLLTAVRPAMAAHLDHAEVVARRMNVR